MRMPWALSRSLLLVEFTNTPSSSSREPVDDMRPDLPLRPFQPTLKLSLMGHTQRHTHTVRH